MGRTADRNWREARGQTVDPDIYSGEVVEALGLVDALAHAFMLRRAG